MTQSLKSNIVNINSRTIQEVRKEYNLDKPGIEMGSRDYLERIIISTKGSVEKAKKRMDKVCTMRTLVPNLFQKCDAKNDFPNLQNWYINLNMPVITEDNHRIFIVKTFSKPFSASVFLEAYQYSVILCEYMKLYDYTIGYHVIIDLRETSIMDLVTKIDLVDLRNIMSLYTDGYGFRIKNIYVLSNSSMIGAFIDILKQIVTAKIGQRITICKSIEALHESLPQHLLPQDYGGGQESILTHYKEWTEELSLDKHVAYMKEMRAAGTNENLRRPDKFNEDYLGMPGSFKMLHVD